jgi:hypothetical protein
MTATIYDAYGEDGDYQYVNGAVGSGIGIVTSGNQFRAGYARCAVQFFGGTAFGVRFWSTGPRTTAWFGMRIWCSNSADSPTKAWGLIDAGGVLRIAIQDTSSSTPAAAYNVYKRDAAGDLTLLGTTSSGFSPTPSEPDQFSCNFDYSTTGFLKLYINSSIVFNYSGDITTDGQTQLAGTYHSGYQAGGEYCAISECIVSDGDTRDMGIRTVAATGAGTVDQWTGAYTNVNEIQVNDSNFDTTATSGNVQRYLMSAIPTGNYNILAKATSLRATEGGGSLAHIALDELIGGTQYATSPVAFPTAFGNVTFVQPVNPATGVAWTQADINASGRESGYKATT